MAHRARDHDHAQLAAPRGVRPTPGSNVSSITPPRRSFSAGPAPLYGMWFSFTLASRLNTSVAMCGEVPFPGVP